MKRFMKLFLFHDNAMDDAHDQIDEDDDEFTVQIGGGQVSV